MKLLVDGVFFQFANTGIARVWSSILPRLAGYPDLDIALLDRGNCPSIPGVERIEFPSYTWFNTADDSFLVDRFCLDIGADVFMSTYYTTPVTVPSVLVVYDMIPEVLEFNLNDRGWKEKQIAISFASYYACISENTRSDLKRFYPAVNDDRAIVAHCGLERDTFRPRERAEVEAFRRHYGIVKPYYVLVGSREQTLGYKNASLFFEAVRQIRNFQFEIICIGGEPKVHRDDSGDSPSGVTVRYLNLSDDELSCAYSGAEALIYPSLYEGFGMPVIEAMACGCPVVTTRLGSIGEVAGEAATFISGRDRDELRRAMVLIQEPGYRKNIIERGIQQATLYSWDNMTQRVYGLLKKANSERQNASTRRFFEEWKTLRSLQADVDVGF